MYVHCINQCLHTTVIYMKGMLFLDFFFLLPKKQTNQPKILVVWPELPSVKFRFYFIYIQFGPDQKCTPKHQCGRAQPGPAICNHNGTIINYTQLAFDASYSVVAGCPTEPE